MTDIYFVSKFDGHPTELLEIIDLFVAKKYPDRPGMFLYSDNRMQRDDFLIAMTVGSHQGKIYLQGKLTPNGWYCVLTCKFSKPDWEKLKRYYFELKEFSEIQGMPIIGGIEKRGGGKSSLPIEMRKAIVDGYYQRKKDDGISLESYLYSTVETLGLAEKLNIPKEKASSTVLLEYCNRNTFYRWVKEFKKSS